jgi:hypothetical protein
VTATTDRLIGSDAKISPAQATEPIFRSTFRPPATPHFSTKTPLKTHTGGCRVRRKRQRLASNGFIESDAAISLR